jgi:GR25 family glycosyltransferase involved in LPS biosynthesis
MGGCLTHLSIINDAWLSGYNTIWILEDDITAKSNPHSLADFLDKLDIDAGERTWDLLYTDDDDFFSSSDVCSHFGSSKWIRPGMPLNQTLLERRPVGNDFFKIGGRTQAHSYILRRTGMKKILDFVKSQGLFLPFDTELPCVPDLQLYNLRYDVVHGRDRKYSDTWNKNF